MVQERLRQRLIQTSHHIMEGKFEGSEEVVQSEIVDLLIVVDVVNFYFESLLLLEVVVNCDFGYKVWIECIMDGFSLSDLDPDITLRFKEDE